MAYQVASRSVLPSSGLTLVELLIAVALLAIVTPLAYRGLNSVTRTSEHMQSEIERWQNLDLSFERLRSDVSQVLGRSIRSQSGSEVPAWLGSATRIEFTRASGRGHPPVRVAYALIGDQLKLTVWPVLDRPIGVKESEGEEYVLIDNVATLSFGHLDTNGAWQPSWVDVVRLPAALRAEIKTRDGVTFHRVFAVL